MIGQKEVWSSIPGESCIRKFDDLLMNTVTIKRLVPLVLFIFVLAYPLYSTEGKPSSKLEKGKNEARSARTASAPLPLRSPLDNLDPRAYDSYVNGLLLTEIDDLADAAISFKKALEYFPESFEIGYALASTYYNMRKPNEALQVLSQLIPRNVDVYLLSAACFRALGDNENAKDAHLRVVLLDSSNVTSLSYLANAYRQMNKADSLLWVYEKLVRVAPGANQNVWNDIGKLRAQFGNMTGARDAFRTSIDINHEAANALAYAALGELYDVLKQPDSALFVLKEGLRVTSDNVLLYRTMTSHYLKLDSFVPAIPFAKKICELMPLDKSSMRRLAIIYFGADSLHQADSIFSYLETGNEKEPADHFYLGQIAARGKDYGRALKEFKTLTLLADTSAESWLALGSVYRLQDSLESELAAYQEGLNHMVSESSALRLFFAQGATEERNGRFDDAVGTFEKILSKAPKHSQSLNYLVYMLADRGVRLDYARDLIARALELEPENPAFLDSYGWVYYRLGKYSKSVEYLRKAVGLIADSVVYDHLGDVLKAKGQLDEARVWWEKALQLAPNSSAIREKLGR